MCFVRRTYRPTQSGNSPIVIIFGSGDSTEHYVILKFYDNGVLLPRTC
jgi:hypothetical protein